MYIIFSIFILVDKLLRTPLSNALHMRGNPHPTMYIGKRNQSHIGFIKFIIPDHSNISTYKPVKSQRKKSIQDKLFLDIKGG